MQNDQGQSDRPLYLKGSRSVGLTSPPAGIEKGKLYVLYQLLKEATSANLRVNIRK